MKSRLYKPIVFIAAAILLSTNCEGPEEPEEVTEDTFMNQWTKHPDNPVLAPGTSGDWDDERVGSSNVLQDGTTYRMWYAGYDGAVYRIGYATSLDRINWTKDATNPVLDVGPAGSWDDVWIGGHNTLFDGTTYHMWYSGNDSSNWRIGYATSPDGVNWTKYATNPVLDLGSAGSWDDTTVYVPSVILDGSTFHMWYNGYDGAVYRIGYATSPDGINWTKDATNPVLDVGPAGSWDDLSVSTPFVRSYGDTYQMWYTGNDGADQRIGYATSPDGVDWTKDATNPVLDVGPVGSWDDSDVFIPWVIDDGSTFHMWYTGNDGANNLRIGYATSDATTNH